MNKKVLASIVVIVLIVAGVAGFLGYVYTHPKKTNLPSIKITALSPLNSVEEFELDSIVSNLKAVGIPAKISLVSPTVEGTWLSPNSTPEFVDLGWLPDWPDPVAQQFDPFATYSNGGAFGANNAWVDNATLNNAFPGVIFNSNKTAQQMEMEKLYKIFYDQYSYIWLPNPSTYFFVQPYINNFTYNPYENYYYNMMSYNTSYKLPNGSNTYGPSNTSVLTDVADGDSLAAPDYLDPSHGFFVQDGPMFTGAYQELYELNGTNYNQVVPVLANTSVKDATSNYMNYNITLRNGITFNNSDPVNASTVWFSYYRTLVMAQGVSIDNYGGMLFNTTAYSATSPYSLPVGFLKDMRHAYNVTQYGKLKLPYPTNYSNLNMSNTVFAAKFLASMLSDYHPWSNTTQALLLTYKDQAVSVPSFSSNHAALNFTINLLNPYPFFLQDTAEWWGNIADPLFLDTHGGVTATSPNNYTDSNGMPGTGPYHIKTVGAALDSVTMTKVSNYWGNKYWDNKTGKGMYGFPAVAQPAHIKTIVMDYTVDHSGRVSGFLDNQYQMSEVSASYLGSIIGVSPFTSSVPVSSYFKNVGATPAAFDLSMNNFISPTNNSNVREGIWYAINYTALDHPFYYKLSNGTTELLAQNYIGPISPGFKSFYVNDTQGLAAPAQNLSLAIHYLGMGLKQEGYYVTLPNGTRIGDTSISDSSLAVLTSAILSMNQLVENTSMAMVRIF
ncbi:ABC transporter substrate-binding protein [Oxyplasma meridianum]|uniref:ABC transporter substrate-binding protein n=1 Tax=Oxyplasma meridianum TaxID=3073602 RepID=A0AAX4NEY9_9ARCH